MPLPVFQPLAVKRRPAPFDHPDYLFEIKWDGFRTLARV
jgi:ATP-dependent DNA ligase